MAENKKYYWLKLQKDFFKRHDIRIVEAMPNGKDYILFYMKLLLESIDHEGELRFSDTVPYNADMLAIITNTNVDVVRSAMKVFENLQMIEILDDETIFMKETEKMIGSETAAAERQRKHREKMAAICAEESAKTALLSSNCDNVTTPLQNSHIELDIDIEKDIDIELEKDKEKEEKKPRPRFVPPTVEEIRNYCLERNNNVDAEAFFDYYTSKDWYIGKNKMKDWRAAVRNWERHEREFKPAQQAPRNPQRTNNVFLDMINGGNT